MRREAVPHDRDELVVDFFLVVLVSLIEGKEVSIRFDMELW